MPFNKDLSAVPTDAFRNLNLSVKSDIKSLHQEIAKGKILEAALSDIMQSPDFNPAAISVVFGLKW